MRSGQRLNCKREWRDNRNDAAEWRRGVEHRCTESFALAAPQEFLARCGDVVCAPGDELRGIIWTADDEVSVLVIKAGGDAVARRTACDQRR